MRTSMTIDHRRRQVTRRAILILHVEDGHGLHGFSAFDYIYM